LSTEAQGGILKNVFIDTVYMNDMRLESECEGPDYMLCDDIDECVKFELHCSNIVQRVISGRKLQLLQSVATEQNEHILSGICMYVCYIYVYV
jgi:hypothetical protein